jgi:DNA/RNA endonuclease YhcR with UshA esterase domain
MKHIRIALAVVALGLLGGMPSRMIAQDKAPPKYDVAAQQTVEGTVQEVKDYKCPVTGTIGSHITIKTSGGALEVHMAPATFLKDYEMKLQAGDSVKVVGVKFTFEGQPAMLARSVTIGHATFTFRDDKGRPLW